MKTMQLMAAALCAVAFVNTASFADDNGLEPATPPPAPIADPVNPQPGMIFSAYEDNPWMMDDEPRGKL